MSIVSLITSAIGARPLLTSDDAYTVEQVAWAIVSDRWNDDELKAAVEVSATAVENFRRALRAGPALEFAANLPVRKASPAVDGKARYYWRVVMPDGSLASAVKQDEKHQGTIQNARQKARELYIRGVIVTELVPPDYDPTNRADEFQRNTSKFQPAGLAVHQRSKKV